MPLNEDKTVTIGLLAYFKEKMAEILSSVGSGISGATGAAWAKKHMESKPDMIYAATSSDGVAYTADIPGITSLYAGLQITVQLNRSTASTMPTLNVNGLGAKGVRQPLSTNNVATTAGSLNAWISSACPVVLTYTGSQWKTEHYRPAASSLYGSVPVANGGTGATTADAARTNLGAASQADLEALMARVSALDGQ